MCQVAGNRDQLITLLLPLAEHMLNITLIHFQDGYIPFFLFSFLLFPIKILLFCFPFLTSLFFLQLYYPRWKCWHKNNNIRRQIWPWARHLRILWGVDSNIRKTWIAWRGMLLLSSSTNYRSIGTWSCPVTSYLG